MTLTKSRLLAAAAVLALTGCAPATNAEEGAVSAADSGILAEFGLDGLAGQEIIDRLDRTPVAARQAELKASVRPGELVLTRAGSEDSTVVDLPDGLFYLSIAPYIERTHECYNHSLTTCRGELAGKELHVRIAKRGSGDVLVDEVTTTFDNGFVGYWLPSGIEATVRIDYQGYSAVHDIATRPDDPTCLTTLHLEPSS